MDYKDIVTTYYSNARIFIVQNNPKAARDYVGAMLNAGQAADKQAKTILLKAKWEVFIDQWTEVARDLYDKGITDYVLQSFNLPTRRAAEPREEVRRQVDAKPAAPSPTFDMGILEPEEQAEDTQGWCADVFEKNRTSVVQINISERRKCSGGTGFIISPKGYLLTNDHVVFDEDNGCYHKKITISFASNKKAHKLGVLFSDKKSDVALCKFDVEGAPQFGCVKMISDYHMVKQGADCLVIGNAFGMGIAPFAGVVRFTLNEDGDLVYTAPSNPGDSGGPVLNRQGECIGMNKSKTVAVNHVVAEGYANATPMDTIAALLHKWTSYNNIKL